MIKFEESRMEFTLTDDRVSCIKFDETTFLRSILKSCKDQRELIF